MHLINVPGFSPDKHFYVMNIINSALLRFVLIASPLYKKMGVNVRHLEVILTAKLKMDDRRPNTFQQFQSKKNKRPVRYATIGTMILAVVMGLVFLSSFMVGKTYETKFTIYFSFYVTVLASILIADFTSVLIDVRDNYIILPKPVTDKTFVISRLLHIFIHVCKLVIPMIIPAIVFLMINKSVLSILPFLFVTLMATLFTIFLISSAYIFILKITTPARFQTIITYIQILFAVGFYAGYQLVPRLVTSSLLSRYELSDRTGIMFLPTYWFAGAWQQLYGWNNSFKLWMCVAFTIIVPALSMWAVIKYFAPSFNRKLSMITGSIADAQKGKKIVVKKSSSQYSNLLSKIFTKSGVERASFLFTWKMMLRSRNFKMKTYPAFGYMVVIMILMMIQNHTLSFKDITLQTKDGIISTLIIIYFSNILLFSALTQLTTDEKYKAAWIFFTTPVKTPGTIISGSVKAAIAQFFFPFALIIFLFFGILCRPSVMPNVLLGISNELLIAAITAYMGVSKLPFSAPQQNNSGNVLRVFSLIVLVIVMAFLHFIVYRIILVVSILAVLSIVATWLVFDAVSRFSWNKIYSSYEE